METPKAEIIKLNLDCQGTHYPQSEIDELVRRATESSLWEERFHNAAQANARLEGLLEKATEALKAVYYHCDECGEEVDAKDVTTSGFPQKFFCPNCVYDFVDSDR